MYSDIFYYLYLYWLWKEKTFIILLTHRIKYSINYRGIISTTLIFYISLLYILIQIITQV